MTKLDFHRFQVRHFNDHFEQFYGYREDGATPKSRSKCPWTFKNHYQAKYQRVNANTLYVAAILFSCSTLHRETLPCLPNIWLGRFSGNRETSGVQIPPEQASLACPKSKKKTGRALIRALQTCYAHNFPASLLVLGAEILCLHYELLIKLTNQVPITVVFGDVGQGKSRATRAALSLLGVHQSNYFHELTDSRTLKMTSSTTLGVVIDDPSDAHSVAEKIVQHFEKSSHGSAHITYTPRTTFITSMNYRCLNQLSREQRYNTLVYVVCTSL